MILSYFESINKSKRTQQIIDKLFVLSLDYIMSVENYWEACSTRVLELFVVLTYALGDFKLEIVGIL